MRPGQFILLFVWFLILTECKTARITPGKFVKQQEKEAIAPEGELRGYFIPPVIYSANTQEDLKISLINIIQSTVAANLNVLFLPIGIDYFPHDLNSEKNAGSTSHTELIGEIIEMAQIQKLKICLVVDVAQIFIREHDDIPGLKSMIKKDIRSLVASYEMDGLCFDMTGRYSFSDAKPDTLNTDKKTMESVTDDTLKMVFNSTHQDILEDLVVEAMLYKPYLLTSLIQSSVQDQSSMFKILESGIVDFLFTEFQKRNEDQVRDLDVFLDTFAINSRISRIFPLLSFISDGNSGTEYGEEMLESLHMQDLKGISFAVNDRSDLSGVSIHVPVLFREKVEFPINLKNTEAQQVIELDVSDFLKSMHGYAPTIEVFPGGKAKYPDSRGILNMIMPEGDTLVLRQEEREVVLPTSEWLPPCRYSINSEGKVSRKSPWIELRRAPEKITHDSTYHMLYKTEYPSKALINGRMVKVYKTGIFFDQVFLKEGSNRIRTNIITPDSLSTFYETEFVYKKLDTRREILPLWIDTNSVTPDVDLELLPGDVVQVGFNGSRGQSGMVEVLPEGLTYECQRKDFDDFSVYRADILLNKLQTGVSHQIILRLTTVDNQEGHDLTEVVIQNNVTVRSSEDFPIVRIIKENSRMTFNTGPIRLGGPIRAELGPGVLMRANGKIGEFFRIHLNAFEQGMIHQDDVALMPEQTVWQPYYITNISCAPGEKGDLVSIPYSFPIPYEVYPDPTQNRLVLTLYGAKTSSTWISHRKGRRIIDKITWQQTTPETYQIYINLKTSKIWGYDVIAEEGRLQVSVKYPPVYNPDGTFPLEGLKIAVEAGHGGESTGAVGLSGILEKDINLDLALKFGMIIQDMGGEVIQIRDSDTTMSLIEKRDRAISSGADILISIHANAAGTNQGYLRVPGTSTYYHNPFWAPLAEFTYNRLLDLGLEEFGVVGSFNYTVTRVTQIPAILVEQAFLTHAEDEEKLADPDFRLEMAQKISQGLVDYLNYMRD